MAGAGLNALNIRLDAETVAFILRHGEAKVLIADTELAPLVAQAAARLACQPIGIDIADPAGPGGARLGDIEAFLAAAAPNFAERTPQDEWEAIAASSRFPCEAEGKVFVET